MPAPSLPTVGASTGTWGTELNTWLAPVKHQFHVMDYGADSTGATESWTGIQAALDAAAATSGSGYKGATVVMPPGNFVCHKRLKVADGVTLRGAGKRATIIRGSYDGTTPANDFLKGVIQLGDDGALTVTGSRVENLRIFCGSSAEVGVYTFQANENSSIRNVAIHDFTTYGVSAVQSGANEPVADVELMDSVELFVTASAATAAVYLNNVAGTIMLKNVSANMTGPGTKTPDGILVVKATGSVLLLNTHIENCTDALDIGTGIANDHAGIAIGVHTNNCTNAVHFQNAQGSTRWSVYGVKAVNFTNSILDDLAGVSLTNAYVTNYTTPSVGQRIGAVVDTSGAGSPEAVIVGAVGSTYRRTDGGAGTSFYVKESTTVVDGGDGVNLVTNPDFESDATGWLQSGTNTVVSDATQAKTGTKSGKMTYGNTGAPLTQINITATASTTYQCWCWVWIPTNWDGGTVTLGATNFSGASGSALATATRDAWQKIQFNITLASDNTGQLALNATAPTVGRFIYIDDVHWEKLVLAGTTGWAAK